MRFGTLSALALLVVWALPAAAQPDVPEPDEAADTGVGAAAGAAPWDVPVPAQMNPALGLNSSAPAPVQSQRPPALDMGDVPDGGGSAMPPPIPFDVTQVQVVDALEDVARRTKAAAAASGIVDADAPVSASDFDFSQDEPSAVNESPFAQLLASDSDAQQAISQLAILLASMGSSADDAANDPAQAAASFNLGSSPSSDSDADGGVLEFNPLAAAGAPTSKWAIARKVGRDVLVLTRYALTVHADMYDMTKQSDDEPWSRKAVTVVDELISFLDFIEERLPSS